MKKIQVIMADDYSVLRAGLSLLLNAEPDIEVVGEAGDGDEAVARTVELTPDVLLLDIAMPGLGVLDVIRTIKAKNMPVAVLILTIYDDEGYLREVLKAGAMGYVPKKVAETALIPAIRTVHRGEVFIYPSLTKGLVQEVLQGSVDKEMPTDSDQRLSLREREVLKLIAQGYTNRQIADRLFVSVETVQTNKAWVMEKLDLHGRTELVRYALQVGLFTQET